ncbi:MAG TPA: hypothetical protein VFE47_16915 [Tepidisphaeraceae bacterium]|jgi:hypothetical protein|nr:hypothetical protein [Tepidisphaeraceae bacterium]
MVIELSADAETRLKEVALRRGIAADQLVEELIREAAAKTQVRPGESTLALFDEWEREDATDDPQEIARRQAEFDELKRAMNQTRLATDGPDARIPFP